MYMYTYVETRRDREKYLSVPPLFRYPNLKYVFLNGVIKRYLYVCLPVHSLSAFMFDILSV